MWRRYSIYVVLYVFGACVLYAQSSSYVVFFTDKAGTPYQIDEPERYLSPRSLSRRLRHGVVVTSEDLPVSPDYLRALSAQEGILLRYTTKWMNGVLVEMEESKLESVEALSYVDSVEFVKPGRVISISIGGEEDQGDSVKGGSFLTGQNALQNAMLGIDVLHEEGFRGRGILIALLDGGYYSANNAPSSSTMLSSFLLHIEQEGRLLDTYSYVRHSEDVFRSSFGEHGSLVLSTIAGYRLGEYVGAAPEASFALFTTEDSGSEYVIEEYNWLFAAERADSIGADIIQSSVGYFEFDDERMDYSYADMDGETAISSRAARMAYERGILVITSAGNGGSSVTHPYIRAPADAKGVLAIGAVDFRENRIEFSSIGPSVDGRVKPDLMALGFNVVGTGFEVIDPGLSGTSFSAPLISGLAACLMQMFPEAERTHLKTREKLLSLSDRFDTPDNFYGHGIPTYGGGVVPVSTNAPSTFFFYPHPVSLENNPLLRLQWISQEEEVLLGVDIKIFSLLGVQVKHYPRVLPGKNAIEVDMSELVPGVYIMRLRADFQNFIHTDLVRAKEEIHRLAIFP